MKTKLFTLFLALTTSTGILFAESGKCGSNLTWEFTDGVLTISGSGEMYDWYQVFDVPWYSCRQNITSVTIGNSVKTIGQYAFYGCSRITSITIPNSVTSIRNYAFWGCSSLTSIIIPNSVTIIGQAAFYGCSSLTSVTLGNSITSIGGSAFYECTGLTSITIPNSVTISGIYAFYRCSSLASVTIGNSVTNIGSYAFWYCSRLTSITIPNSVTSIGDHAFYNCSGLTSITIPNSVTNIGNEAFYRCTGLMSVTCNATDPPTLGNNAFVECTKLESIIVPCGALNNYNNKVNWNNYAEIIINPEISHVEGFAKDNIGGEVVVPTSACDDQRIEAIPDYGYHFVRWSDGNTDNPRNVVITQDTTFTAEFAIDKSGKCGENLALKWEYEDKSKLLTINGNGALIENYSFGLEAPTQMRQLIIGNEITSIGDSAFFGMASINHLTIGSNVTSIGDYAFAECKNFDDITCYAYDVPTISDKTFDKIGNKKYIYLYVPEGRQRAYLRDEYWGEFDVQVKNAETVVEPIVNVIIVPTDNTAEISWPIVQGADTYEIIITKNDEIVCTLIFNTAGQLTGIAFAPSRNNTKEQQTEGFKFTVTGLTSNTDYGYSIVAKNDGAQTLDTKSGFFKTTGVATGIDQITKDQSPITNKVIRDGQIFILRGDKVYTVDGRLTN